MSSLEQILLAIQNIYEKCKSKSDWTIHKLEGKASEDKNSYEDRGNIILTHLVNRAKQMIKNINNYIQDYQAIIEGCKNDKNDRNKY